MSNKMFSFLAAVVCAAGVSMSVCRAALMFMQSSSAFLRLCFARTKQLFLTAVIMPMWV